MNTPIRSSSEASRRSERRSLSVDSSTGRGRANLPIAGVTLLLLVTVALTGPGLSRCREATLLGEQGQHQTDTARQSRVVRTAWTTRVVRRQDERPRGHELLLAAISRQRLLITAITPRRTVFVQTQQPTPRDRADQGMIGLAPPMLIVG